MGRLSPSVSRFFLNLSSCAILSLLARDVKWRCCRVIQLRQHLTHHLRFCTFCEQCTKGECRCSSLRCWRLLLETVQFRASPLSCYGASASVLYQKLVSVSP